MLEKGAYRQKWNQSLSIEVHKRVHGLVWARPLVLGVMVVVVSLDVVKNLQSLSAK